MHRCLLSCLTGVAALASALAAQAAPSSAPTAEDALYAAHDIEVVLAPAHSRAQFEAWVAANPSPDIDPFVLLSADARRRFLDSLDFERIRMGGAPELADVEAELTLSQAWRLLAVVGAQLGVVYMPDIRVESPADKVIDEWRKIFELAEQPSAAEK